MVARKVAARLRPNSLARFANLMHCEVLPWLRAQEGFLDLLTLAAPDGREVTTISFWDHPANAYTYDASGYPESLKMLGELIDGSPYVKTFEVLGSTIHTVEPSHLHQAEDLARKEVPASREWLV
jgi:hypothetical protein